MTCFTKKSNDNACAGPRQQPSLAAPGERPGQAKKAQRTQNTHTHKPLKESTPRC